MSLKIDVKKFNKLMLERYYNFDSIEYIVINRKRNKVLVNFNCYFKNFNKKINFLKIVNFFFFVLTRFITLRGLCEICITSAKVARAKRLRSACSSLFIASYLLFIILRKSSIRELYEFAFLFFFSFFSSSSGVVI